MTNSKLNSQNDRMYREIPCSRRYFPKRIIVKKENDEKEPLSSFHVSCITIIYCIHIYILIVTYSKLCLSLTCYAPYWVLLPLDILVEYWIEHVTVGLLYVMFSLSSQIFYIGFSGCFCGIRLFLRHLTPCINHLSLVCRSSYGNLVGNDSESVSLIQWKTIYSLF